MQARSRLFALTLFTVPVWVACAQASSRSRSTPVGRGASPTIGSRRATSPSTAVRARCSPKRRRHR